LHVFFFFSFINALINVGNGERTDRIVRFLDIAVPSSFFFRNFTVARRVISP